jgi:hypothetical protein
VRRGRATPLYWMRIPRRRARSALRVGPPAMPADGTATVLRLHQSPGRVEGSSSAAPPATRSRALILRQRALVEEFVDVAQHVVGDDGMAFGGGVERAAVEGGVGRLQVVERRDAFAVGVAGKERVVPRPNMFRRSRGMQRFFDGSGRVAQKHA